MAPHGSAPAAGSAYEKQRKYAHTHTKKKTDTELAGREFHNADHSNCRTQKLGDTYARRTTVFARRRSAKHLQ